MEVTWYVEATIVSFLQLYDVSEQSLNSIYALLRTMSVQWTIFVPFLGWGTNYLEFRISLVMAQKIHIQQDVSDDDKKSTM